MTDSFFTSKNQVDPQIAHTPSLFCDELIEAATRRVVKLEGPMEASKRLQRLADICAGAYVLPIDHWKALGAEPDKPATEPPTPKSRKEQIIGLVAARGYWFAAGMLFSMALSAFQLWVSG